MKRLISICLTALMLAFGGCSSHRIIPDGELTLIFRDAFLVNAITTMKGIRLDSLNIYEPIFESYGYTTEDVQYTIGNFSKRKSARLGDVVERAIVLLDDEGIVYDAQVAVLDTIRAIAQRRSRKLLLEVDEIVVENMSDTTKLMMEIEDIDVGNYHVVFDYLIDSLDENTGNYRSILWFEGLDENGEDRGQDQKVTVYLQRGGVKSYSKSIEVDIQYDTMVLQLVDFMNKKGAPHLKIRDLKVEYTPLDDVAETMLFEDLVNVKIFSDELLPPPIPTDSL